MKVLSIVNPLGTASLAQSIQPFTAPKPELKPNSLQVRVNGASIHCDDANFADPRTFMGRFRVVEEVITGRFQFDPVPTLESPYIPGADLAGIVEAVGAEVTNFKPGDEVIGFTWPGRGAWAEYCVTNAEFCHKKPENWSWAEASTASTTIMSVAELMKAADGGVEGKRVMVLGASGTVGRLLVQTLTNNNADVIAVGSKDTSDLLQTCGAATIIDYEKAPFSEQIGPGSVDIVFDCVGGKQAIEEGKLVLKDQGQFLTTVGPMSHTRHEPLSWVNFAVKLNDIGSHMKEGWFGGQRYQYVAGLSPDWTAIEKYIFQPDLRVSVSKTIAFSDMETIRRTIDETITQWERGKAAILHDELMPAEPIAYN